MAERNERFWASFLGSDAADWATPGVSVCAHAGLAGYRGLWSFRHGNRVVVSAPPEWVARLRELVEGVELERLMDPARWQELLGSACSKVIGPAYQGSLEPHRFRPVRDSNVRALEGDVASMLAEFREAVGAEAWLDGGLEKVQGHVAVRRDGSRVVAVSGYRPWTDEVGDPCVLVHPQFQRRGYGSAVVSAIVESALAAGKTVLYQTLEANLGATTIAEKLGYEQFARYLAIRL